MSTVPAAHAAALAEAERVKYEQTWRDPEYRHANHGLNLWLNRRDLFPAEVHSALDIGCGNGRLLHRWYEEGIDAWGYDIAPNCLDAAVAPFVAHRMRYGPLWEMDWGNPLIAYYERHRFDLGVCTDVMEHIPEEMVPASLARIAVCCDRVVFKIAHSPNQLGGQVLHLTLRPVEWWMEQMEKAHECCDVPHARYLGIQIRSGCEDSLVEWSVKP